MWKGTLLAFLSLVMLVESMLEKIKTMVVNLVFWEWSMHVSVPWSFRYNKFKPKYEIFYFLVRDVSLVVLYMYGINLVMYYLGIS